MATVSEKAVLFDLLNRDKEFYAVRNALMGRKVFITDQNRRPRVLRSC